MPGSRNGQSCVDRPADRHQSGCGPRCGCRRRRCRRPSPACGRHAGRAARGRSADRRRTGRTATSAICAEPSLGESTSVTAPVVRCVTIANWPVESANASNGSSGQLAEVGIVVDVRQAVRVVAQREALRARLHDSLVPSQSTHVIEGSPRVGMIRRSAPLPRPGPRSSVAKFPMRTPAPTLEELRLVADQRLGVVGILACSRSGIVWAVGQPLAISIDDREIDHVDRARVVAELGVRVRDEQHRVVGRHRERRSGRRAGRPAGRRRPRTRCTRRPPGARAMNKRAHRAKSALTLRPHRRRLRPASPPTGCPA